ncbi:hypothetical protein ACSDR0_43395 [Streptosporangium sp. G11]|uniref:hypothetical protein n=1 Tax=Streptosporangium sp. G11 TaxID=3436926 RepID=UPI003EC0A892
MSALEILHMPTPLAERQRQADEHRAVCRSAAGGPGCAPWCVFHDAPVCYSTPAGPGSDEVTLTRDPVYGDLFAWWGQEEASLDDAEQFARKILALVAQARAGRTA